MLLRRLLVRVLLVAILLPVLARSSTAAALGPGTWSQTGSMATFRSLAAETLLPNGKVLVSGGFHGASTLTSAELYDPVSGTWSPAGAMSVPRAYHTATLLQNGDVLVAGGKNGQDVAGPFYKSAELYHYLTNTWSPAADMASVRAAHVGVLLGSGEVLVAGGADCNSGCSLTAAAELYDSSTNAWSSAGSMSISREFHTATLLLTGDVLVVAGQTTPSGYSNSAELYHPDTNNWSSAGTLANTREHHSAARLLDGKVLVTGGINGVIGTLLASERYDPGANTWSSAGDMTTPRWGHRSVTLANGKVLTVGGCSVNDCTAVESSAELYHPGANGSTPTGGMSVGRTQPTLTRLSNGTVLVASGGATTSAEIYEPAPPIAVGGIAEQPDVAELPSAAAQSGRSRTLYAFGGAITLIVAAAGAVGLRRSRVHRGVWSEKP